MIAHLAELNRVLIAATSICDEHGSAAVEDVVRQCDSIVVEGRLPDHLVSLDFAAALQLVQRQGATVRLTAAGVAFLELNAGNQYELVEAQRLLLVRTCFLHGPFRDATRRLLRGFTPVFEFETYRWSELDSPALDAEPWMVGHLEQLGLLRSIPNGFEVSAGYQATVSEFLAEGKGFSEEEFKAWLKEKEEIGALAENLALEFERQRLRDLGHTMESRCARRISRLKANAGYDLESYDGKAPPHLNFNRFIEVKGSRDAKVRFFWSENEMSVARKLGDKYWIYYQGGIDLGAGRAKNKPLLFQNPIKSILENREFEVGQHGILVKGGMRGEVLVIA